MCHDTSNAGINASATSLNEVLACKDESCLRFEHDHYRHPLSYAHVPTPCPESSAQNLSTL
eukprot:2826185-Amphidinium_carterae.1